MLKEIQTEKKEIKKYVSRFFQKRGLVGKGSLKVAQVAKQKRTEKINQLRTFIKVQIEKKSIKTNYKNPNRKTQIIKKMSNNPNRT